MDAIIEVGQSSCHSHEQVLYDCSFYVTKIYIFAISAKSIPLTELNGSVSIDPAHTHRMYNFLKRHIF